MKSLYSTGSEYWRNRLAQNAHGGQIARGDAFLVDMWNGLRARKRVRTAAHLAAVLGSDEEFAATIGDVMSIADAIETNRVGDRFDWGSLLSVDSNPNASLSKTHRWLSDKGESLAGEINDDWTLKAMQSVQGNSAHVSVLVAGELQLESKSNTGELAAFRRRHLAEGFTFSGTIQGAGLKNMGQLTLREVTAEAHGQDGEVDADYFSTLSMERIFPTLVTMADADVPRSALLQVGYIPRIGLEIVTA